MVQHECIVFKYRFASDRFAVQYDIAANIHVAITAGDSLVELGYMAYVPQVSHLWHMVSPKPYEYWLSLDLAILKHCTAVLRLRGESKGADIEVKFAKDNNIPVFFNIPDVVGYLNRKGAHTS